MRAEALGLNSELHCGFLRGIKDYDVKVISGDLLIDGHLNRKVGTGRPEQGGYDDIGHTLLTKSPPEADFEIQEVGDERR